jgi:hypothetical protein
VPFLDAIDELLGVSPVPGARCKTSAVGVIMLRPRHTVTGGTLEPPPDSRLPTPKSPPRYFFISGSEYSPST